MEAVLLKAVLLKAVLVEARVFDLRPVTLCVCWRRGDGEAMQVDDMVLVSYLLARWPAGRKSMIYHRKRPGTDFRTVTWRSALLAGDLNKNRTVRALNDQTVGKSGGKVTREGKTGLSGTPSDGPRPCPSV